MKISASHLMVKPYNTYYSAGEFAYVARLSKATAKVMRNFLSRSSREYKNMTIAQRSQELQKAIKKRDVIKVKVILLSGAILPKLLEDEGIVSKNEKIALICLELVSSTIRAFAFANAIRNYKYDFAERIMDCGPFDREGVGKMTVDMAVEKLIKRKEVIHHWQLYKKILSLGILSDVARNMYIRSAARRNMTEAVKALLDTGPIREGTRSFLFGQAKLNKNLVLQHMVEPKG